jgi:hypothetical protein
MNGDVNTGEKSMRGSLKLTAYTSIFTSALSTSILFLTLRDRLGGCADRIGTAMMRGRVVNFVNLRLWVEAVLRFARHSRFGTHEVASRRSISEVSYVRRSQRDAGKRAKADKDGWTDYPMQPPHK